MMFKLQKLTLSFRNVVESQSFGRSSVVVSVAGIVMLAFSFGRRNNLPRDQQGCKFDT